MSRAKVEIDVDAMGMGEIRVNGEPVKGIYRTEMTSEAGELTEVVLHRRALDVSMKGEADVRVMVGGEEFGWEDVGLLRAMAAEQTELSGALAELVDEEDSAPVRFRRTALTDLADRIAALLLPREME